VVLFDASTGRELARFEDPNLDISYPPAFARDGTQLITVSIGNGKGLHVWDLRRIRRTLKEMDLDWDAPDFPPEPEVRPPVRATFVQPELAKLPPNWNPNAQPRDRDRWQGQVALYSLALAFQPVNPEAHFRRGYAYHQLKQEQEAVADFDRALALRPRHKNALHFRAHAFEQLGRWDRAEADFTTALVGQPDDAHFLDRRGRCRLQLNQVDDGIADLERSLAAKPDQPDLTRFLAEQCNNRAWKLLTAPQPQHDPARAIRLSEKAVKLKPDEHLFVNTLGVAQYRFGRYQEAAATLEKSLTLGKDRFLAFDLYFLAMCRAKLDDAAKANDCFDRAAKWHDEQREKLSATYQQELTQFRAEAIEVLKAAEKKGGP
jgi:tetratricopeptide (TPR) repeat protein